MLKSDHVMARTQVPLYKEQFGQYATGALPSNHGASQFSAEHDCLYNTPGNEGQ